MAQKRHPAPSTVTGVMKVGTKVLSETGGQISARVFSLGILKMKCKLCPSEDAMEVMCDTADVLRIVTVLSVLASPILPRHWLEMGKSLH